MNAEQRYRRALVLIQAELEKVAHHPHTFPPADPFKIRVAAIVREALGR